MIALPDAAAITAAVALLSASDGSVPSGPSGVDRARRTVARRARDLGCQHLIPMEWLRSFPRPRTPATAHHPHPRDLYPYPLTAAARPPEPVLRKAFMRAVREYTMISPHSRPPIPRDVYARARAAALIRRSEGDPTPARDEDLDLLPTPASTGGAL